MTEKSLTLLDALLELTYSNDSSKEQLAAYNAFKAHIEELERKAQAWDTCQDAQEAFVRVAALLSRKGN